MLRPKSVCECVCVVVEYIHFPQRLLENENKIKTGDNNIRSNNNVVKNN